MWSIFPKVRSCFISVYGFKNMIVTKVWVLVDLWVHGIYDRCSTHVNPQLYLLLIATTSCPWVRERWKVLTAVSCGHLDFYIYKAAQIPCEVCIQSDIKTCEVVSRPSVTIKKIKVYVITQKLGSKLWLSRNLVSLPFFFVAS